MKMENKYGNLILYQRNLPKDAQSMLENIRSIIAFLKMEQ